MWLWGRKRRRGVLLVVRGRLWMFGPSCRRAHEEGRAEDDWRYGGSGRRNKSARLRAQEVRRGEPKRLIGNGWWIVLIWLWKRRRAGRFLVCEGFRLHLVAPGWPTLLCSLVDRLRLVDQHSAVGYVMEAPLRETWVEMAVLETDF